MINNSLKIAAVPLDIAWADRDTNLQRAALAMAHIEPDTDVVVFPELMSTGFISDADVLRTAAEPMSGPTVTRLTELASRHNVAIAGSFLACDGPDSPVVNRAFFIEPSGEITVYDKRHLFSLSPESRLMSPGRRPWPVVRFRGWNIALTVCFDLRFPVWCRNRHMAYDVMLVPANWPQVRGYAWERLLQGRAIENQAYYVGANRGGSDDYGVYDDLTFIIDFDGRHAGRVDSATGIVYAVTDREGINRTRTRMPAAAAADEFSITL